MQGNDDDVDNDKSQDDVDDDFYKHLSTNYIVESITGFTYLKCLPYKKTVSMYIWMCLYLSNKQTVGGWIDGCMGLFVSIKHPQVLSYASRNTLTNNDNKHIKRIYKFVEISSTSLVYKSNREKKAHVQISQQKILRSVHFSISYEFSYQNS